MKDVKLTDKQFEELRDNYERIKFAPKFIAAIINEMHDEVDRKRKSLWDEVAKLFNYKNFLEIARDQKTLKISWLRGVVELIEEDEINKSDIQKQWPPGANE